MPKRPTRRSNRPRRPPPPINPLDQLHQLLIDRVEERMDSLLDQFFTTMFPGQDQARFTPIVPPIPKAKPSRAAKSQPTTPPSPTLYDILQISPAASPEVIAGAWRSLCKLYHPDLKPGHEKKMKEINLAYDTLGDPIKRKQYDQFLKNLP